MDEKLYLIWLSGCVSAGSPLGARLLKYFGNARAVFEASEADLSEAPVEWNGRMKPFLQKDLSWAEGVLDYCEKNGVGICTSSDHFYPKRLFDLSNPPLILYHIGAFCDLDQIPSVTVVGAREPSAYGERCAKRLCVDLARGGATLVSGMARGIDGIAHRAALYCEAPTVAVLGCGIDRAYPPEHRELMEAISQTGLVLTEYAPGTPPLARHFPMRNRILAALSPVTLVVEAAASSGSLITAEQALRLKRELYSVPASIFSAASAGSNHLLRLGAKCALRAEDVLASLARTFPQEISAPEKTVKPKRTPKGAGYRFPGSERETLPPEYRKSPPKAAKPKKPPVQKTSLLELSDDERDLLLRLTHEPVFVDTLVDENFTAARVMRTLSLLELHGHVERKSGNRVCLTDDAE